MQTLFLLVLLLFFSPATAQTTPQPLGPGRVAYYPRVIRLLHSGTANNRLIASFDNGTTGAFYESTNDGATWQSISNIPPTYLAGNCCSGLFEVPQQMGTTPAGTLLWATSVLANASAGAASEIRIYKSTDVGRTWSLLATPIMGTVGLWEAEFTVDSQGRLIMFYSSEE